MKHKQLALLTQGALIAALYTALTYLINYFGWPMAPSRCAFPKL